MVVVRFKNSEDHYDIMKKVKKMKKFAEELEECLEDAIDSDSEMEFRGGSSSYRKEYDDEDTRMEGRYRYRRGRM